MIEGLVILLFEVGSIRQSTTFHESSMVNPKLLLPRHPFAPFPGALSMHTQIGSKTKKPSIGSFRIRSSVHERHQNELKRVELDRYKCVPSIESIYQAFGIYQAPNLVEKMEHTSK